MNIATRSTLAAVAVMTSLLATGCAPKPADSAAGAGGAGTMSNPTPPAVIPDLLTDVADVREKISALAGAIPAAKYEWRPGTGVRSVREVFMHLAGDNYLMPAMLGVPADSSTGITADYKTAQAFEMRKMSRDSVIIALNKSFDHLVAAMKGTSTAKLADSVSFFGSKSTVQGVWVGSTTHLHEHLGQLIAYARMNGVVPPWSK